MYTIEVSTASLKCQKMNMDYEPLMNNQKQIILKDYIKNTGFKEAVQQK